jgi:hypothetical protein
MMLKDHAFMAMALKTGPSRTWEAMQSRLCNLN